MAPKRASKTRTALRLALSLGLLLVLLFFLVDLPETWQHLRQADPLYLLALLILFTADRALMSYKWTLLLACRGVVMGQGEALRAYYLGTFAGSFLPTTLGADALRVGAVSHSGRPSELLAASVVMERALGMVATALAGVLGLAALAGLAVQAPPRHLAWAVTATLVVAAGTVLALLFSLGRASGRLVERLSLRLEGRGGVKGWVVKFLATYHQYRQHPRALLWFLLLSLLEQAAPIAGNWLTAQALHLDISPLAIAAVTPVAISLARLPVWFSSFGVVEGFFVVFFGLVGVGPTQAFLLGLVSNVVILAASLPGLWFYLRGGLKGQG